ncbi:MAG TPA: hypothetical protein PKC50_03160 [Elusimicrobiota bacterium]|nr:hypothetical protein [Elusimicrobiota bacterium]
MKYFRALAPVVPILMSACAKPDPTKFNFVARNLAADGRAYGVAVGPGGDVYQAGSFVAGRYLSGGPINGSLWLGRWSPDLRLLNARSIDGLFPGQDAAYGVAVDPAGNVYAVGFVAVLSGGEAPWVGKFDRNLNPLGSFTGSPAVEGRRKYSQTIAVGSEENIFLGGWIGHRPSEANEVLGENVAHYGRGQIPWLAKMSPALVPLKEIFRDDVGSGLQRVCALAPDPAGGVYAAGAVSSRSTSGEKRWWVAHYDRNLALLAEYASPAGGDFEARGAVLAGDGSLWIAGCEGQHGFVAHFSADLKPLSQRTFEPKPLRWAPVVRPLGLALAPKGLWLSGYLTEMDRNRDDEPQSAFLAQIPLEEGSPLSLDYVRSGGDRTFGWGVATDKDGNAYVSGAFHRERNRFDPFLGRAPARR